MRMRASDVAKGCDPRRGVVRVRALVLAGFIAILSVLAWMYGAPDANAASNCRRVATTRTISSYEGVLLVRMRMEKSFCWDYQEVTKAPPAKMTVQVTEAGRAQGFVYKGLLKSSDAFFYYDGSARGGHVSRRQARLVRCEPTGCSVQPTPTLKTFVYNTGSVYHAN